MIQVVFLSVIAIAWLAFASIQDLKHREIANWLNFSLIVFVFGFRFFYSLFSNSGSFGFFYQGLIGLGIFFVLGNIFYYGKLFAGGDAKLMIALGTVLPFSKNFFMNTEIFINFILIFLVVGLLYGLIVSIFLSIKYFGKFKREFRKQFRKHKNISIIVLFLAIAIAIFGFSLENVLLIYFALLVFALPYFFVYAKAVDESCMVRKISTKNLTEGDWLYHDMKIGNKKIKATWHGLRKEEIILIRKKHKTVLVRYGIPFSPVFLISFLIFLWIWKNGLTGILF